MAVSVDDSSGKATKVPAGRDQRLVVHRCDNGTPIQLNGMYCDSVKNMTYTNVQFLYSCDGHADLHRQAGQRHVRRLDAEATPPATSTSTAFAARA